MGGRWKSPALCSYSEAGFSYRCSPLRCQTDVDNRVSVFVRCFVISWSVCGLIGRFTNLVTLTSFSSGRAERDHHQPTTVTNLSIGHREDPRVSIPNAGDRGRVVEGVATATATKPATAPATRAAATAATASFPATHHGCCRQQRWRADNTRRTSGGGGGSPVIFVRP